MASALSFPTTTYISSLFPFAEASSSIILLTSCFTQFLKSLPLAWKSKKKSTVCHKEEVLVAAKSKDTNVHRIKR